MELNPNHPTTKRVHDHWHKLCAVLMSKFGQDAVEITMADLEKIGDGEKCIVIDERNGLCMLRLVTMEEGERLMAESKTVWH